VRTYVSSDIFSRWLKWARQRVAMATAVDLPEEIWTKVFRYLEGPDLARAATVCKTWHRVALDDDVCTYAETAPGRTRPPG